jgi:hypothetical protein
MGASLVKTDSRMPKQRIICGRINVSGGTPSIAQGAGFTIADTAAGKVTITFTKPGKALLCAIPAVIENTDATGYSAKIMGTPSESAIVVGIYAADGTDGVLADNVSFYFQAILKD